MRKCTSVRSSLFRAVTPVVHSSQHSAPRRIRQAVLEALESRTLLSAYVVNSTADLGIGSGLTGDLRYCITQANLAGGTETISFDSTVFAAPQTITLSGGQLELSDTTGTETITGPAAGVTVSGNNASHVFQVDGLVTASISGLTITGGFSGGGAGDGGGVNNNGSLTLTNCTVSGNSTSGVDAIGGGVYNKGSLALANCTVSGNSASGFNAAGGGVNNGGSLTMTNCTVSGNSASGIEFFGKGGGVLNVGSLTMTNCTVSGNSTAGLAKSSGGGVYSYGTLTLTNCTVSGNSASGNYSYGGGVDIGGTATLTNCTVSGNSASGIYGYGGGGLFNRNTAMLTNTIVAGNTATTSGPDVVGNFVSHGNNLIGKTDGSAGWIGSDLTGTIASPLNPLLAPLGNYGGPTQTMALLPGSTAINAGTSGAGIPATDQRGLGRVGGVDIGAFESQGFTIAVTSGSGQSAGVFTAFSNALIAKVTANNLIEPVVGGLVTFTSPVSGASASIIGSPATISAGGTASVTATANGITGSYSVSATARGITTPPIFSLTNIGQITITAPGAQTAYEDVDKTISGVSVAASGISTLTVTLGVSHGKR